MRWTEIVFLSVVDRPSIALLLPFHQPNTGRAKPIHLESDVSKSMSSQLRRDDLSDILWPPFSATEPRSSERARLLFCRRAPTRRCISSDQRKLLLRILRLSICTVMDLTHALLIGYELCFEVSSWAELGVFEAWWPKIKPPEELSCNCC